MVLRKKLLVFGERAYVFGNVTGIPCPAEEKENDDVAEESH